MIEKISVQKEKKKSYNENNNSKKTSQTLMSQTVYLGIDSVCDANEDAIPYEDCTDRYN